MEDYKKKYEEALERAKYILHTVETAGCAMHKDLLTEIFPELRESEDERIMQAIIATIHLYYGEPLEDEAKDMIAWLEKQGEQKPTWSEEDEDSVDIAIRIIQNGGDDCAGILDSNKALKWLKSLKDRIQQHE